MQQVDNGFYKILIQNGSTEMPYIKGSTHMDFSFSEGEANTKFYLGEETDISVAEQIKVSLGPNCFAKLDSEEPRLKNPTRLVLNCGGSIKLKTWDTPIFKDGTDHVLNIEWNDEANTVHARIDNNLSSQLTINMGQNTSSGEKIKFNQFIGYTSATLLVELKDELGRMKAAPGVCRDGTKTCFLKG